MSFFGRGCLIDFDEALAVGASGATPFEHCYADYCCGHQCDTGERESKVNRTALSVIHFSSHRVSLMRRDSGKLTKLKMFRSMDSKCNELNWDRKNCGIENWDAENGDMENCVVIWKIGVRKIVTWKIVIWKFVTWKLRYGRFWYGTLRYENCDLDICDMKIGIRKIVMWKIVLWRTVTWEIVIWKTVV